MLYGIEKLNTGDKFKVRSHRYDEVFDTIYTICRPFMQNGKEVYIVYEASDVNICYFFNKGDFEMDGDAVKID